MRHSRNFLSIPCTVVSLLQWNLACDILIALAIKRIHDLPPHLSYVYTLPDITQKTETRHWRAEAVTIGDVFFRASSTKLLTSGKHGCVHVQRQRDVTSNTYSDLNTQPAFSQPLWLTILRGRQHMFSVFTARRVYTMHSADYATAGCLPSVCYTPVLCLNGYTYPGSFFHHRVASPF